MLTIIHTSYPFCRPQMSVDACTHNPRDIVCNKKPCSFGQQPDCACSRSVDTAGRVRFSHFLGVSWNTQRGAWQARIHKADGSPHCIGDFPQEEAAGRAYDEYALQHLGKGAVRNFPPSTYTGTALQYMDMAQYCTGMACCYKGIAFCYIGTALGYRVVLHPETG